MRAKSGNAAALRTAQALTPANVEAILYTRLADLPHFNPDDDRDPLPEAVAGLRGQIRAADAVLFSTPEYAGSLPGSFKNLLDWTIGSGDGGGLYGMAVGWINPSAHASHGGSQGAYQTLRTVLTMAGARIIESACADVPVPRDKVDAEGIIADPQIQEAIARTMRELAGQVDPAHQTTRL